MSKVNFTKTVLHPLPEEDDFYFCNKDHCIRHVVISDQLVVDEFKDCLETNKCSECKLPANLPRLQRFFKMS